MAQKIAEKKTVLIIEWTALPQEMKDICKEHERFQNDSLFRVHSELSIADLKRGKESVEEYYKDQCEPGEYQYKGTLEEFIDDYGLKFSIWLMEQNFDLEGVDEILLDVCW